MIDNIVQPKINKNIVGVYSGFISHIMGIGYTMLYPQMVTLNTPHAAWINPTWLAATWSAMRWLKIWPSQPCRRIGIREHLGASIAMGSTPQMDQMDAWFHRKSHENGMITRGSPILGNHYLQEMFTFLSMVETSHMCGGNLKMLASECLPQRLLGFPVPFEMQPIHINKTQR